ncbi:MAG: ABC transporter substrate-binding protein, partial [Synergistaceae bacterium]
NKKRIGIFYDLDDPYTQQEHEELVRWVKIFGGEIKADIGYSKKLSTAYNAAMTAITESGAEALILPNTEEKTADIVKSARDSGFEGTIIGEDYLDNPIGASTNIFRNSWWIDEISPLDPQIRSVLKEYRSLYNENCPQEDVKAAILAFDGVRWIANCLATAPGYRGEAMRHALLATRNFPLTHATLTIDPRTHGPYNKAMSLIYCESNGGIFQKRIRTVKTEW